MEIKRLFQLILIVAMAIMFTQCEKQGLYDNDLDMFSSKKGGGGNGGGNGGAGKSPQNGDLYGDLYQICRDDNGVPELIEINGTLYVQPYDDEGLILFEIGEEGDPVFEREPIEVEIGRLNIIRAPDRVLDNAMKEVAAVINGHNVIFDPGGRIMGEDNGVYTTVESPLGNMTVYKELMPEQILGDLFTLANSVTPSDIDAMELAVSCLAGATNKETSMTIDQLVYFNTFAGLDGEGQTEPLQDAAGNYYYNFAGFEHSRDIYKTRYLDVTKIEGTTVTRDTVTVFKFMGWEDYTPTITTGIYQFLDAVNDATHVLYEVHEDSYVIHLPDHIE